MHPVAPRLGPSMSRGMRAKSPARRGSATRASSRGVDSGRVAAPADVQVRELCNGRERARAFFGHKSPAPPPRTLPATGSAPQSGSLLGRCTARVKEGLTRIFLPEGYPRSVSEDYLPYQVAWRPARCAWSVIANVHAMSVCMCFCVCAHALCFLTPCVTRCMHAIGVGYAAGILQHGDGNAGFKSCSDGNGRG